MGYFTLVLSLALATSPEGGWEILAELPPGGTPADIQLSGDRTLLILMESDSSDSAYIGEVALDSLPGPGSLRWTGYLPEGEQQNSGFVIVQASDAYPSEPLIPLGIARLSVQGDTLWTAMLDSVEDYEAPFTDMLETGDGGCCFTVGPPRGSDIWRIYCLEGSGALRFESEVHLRGGPMIGLNQMLETEDGDLLLTGVTDDLGMNSFMFLLCFDRRGDLRFRLMEDLIFHASGRLLMTGGSGNIYVAGWTGNERDDGYFMPPLDMDVFLMKLDASGNEIWRSIFQYPRQNTPVLMTLTDEGDVLLVIRSFDEDPGSPEPVEFQLIRYSHS